MWTSILIPALALLPALAFSPYSFDSFELPKLTVLCLLVAAGAMTAACASPSHRLFAIPRVRLNGAAAGLFAATAAATLLSVDPALSLVGSYGRYAGLLRLSECILLYLLCASRPGPWVRPFLIAVTTAAALASLYGVAQHAGLDFGHWDLSVQSGTSALRYRSFSTLASPSFLGLYLVMSLPLVLALLADEERQWARCGYSIALSLISVCLVFTYSRAAWLGAVLGMALQAWAVRGSINLGSVRRRRAGLFIVAGAALTGALLTTMGNHPSAIQRVAGLTDPEHGSVLVRIRLWQSALKMGAARPVLGWGPDTFRYMLGRFAPHGMRLVERHNLSAHNALLDCFTQTGILGLLAWTALWLEAWRAARRSLATHTEAAGEAAAVRAALAAYLVGIQFGFSSLPTEALAWMLLGVLSARDADYDSRRSAGLLVRIVLALTSLVVAGLVVTWYVADVHFQRAEAARDSADLHTAREEVKKAVALRPNLDLYRSSEGEIRERQGEAAFDSYFAAVRANPLEAANHARLAAALETSGREVEAVSEWRATVAWDPLWPEAQNGLGVGYHRLGNDRAAIEAYRRAIDAAPDDAAAYNNLGNAYLSLGQVEAAVGSYHRALALHPGWEPAARNLLEADRLSEISTMQKYRTPAATSRPRSRQ